MTKFFKPKPLVLIPATSPEPFIQLQVAPIEIKDPVKIDQPLSSDILKQVDDLELFFASVELPASIRLNDYAIITNVGLFVHSHIATLRYYHNNELFINYLERLNQLKLKLIS